MNPSMTADPFVIHKSVKEPLVWIPKTAVLMNMDQILRYIDSVPDLDLVSKTISPQTLIDILAWDGFYGRVSNSMEVFYSHQHELEDICGLDVNDLSESVRAYEEFLQNHFQQRLPSNIYHDFIEEGYTVSLWISSTQAILETTSGVELPATHRRARVRSRSFASMGNDPRY